MSKAEHTPGPWEIGSGDDYYIRADAYPKNFPHHFKSDDLGDYLAYVGNRTDDFGEANARLIAAAPDLLDALKTVVAQIEGYERVNNLAPNPGRQHCWDCVAQAHAVIAKAEGAEPNKRAGG